MLFGNLFVFFEFEGLSVIGESTRRTVFIVLLGIATAGFVVFFLLKPFTDTWHHVVESEDAASDNSSQGSSRDDTQNLKSGKVILALADPDEKDSKNGNQHHNDGDVENSKHHHTHGPMHSFKAAVKLLFDPDMVLLCGTFVAMGLHLSFFSGVYSAAIGFTQQFGEDGARYVGISGMLLGAGGTTGEAISSSLRNTTEFESCSIRPGW